MISPLFDTPPGGDNPIEATQPASAPHVPGEDAPSTDDPLERMEALMAAGARQAALDHAETVAATWTGGRRPPGLAAALARCLIDMGAPERAAALIEPLVAEGSAGTGALIAMARALGLCGRHQEALSSLPKQAGSTDNRARCCWRSGLRD